MNRKYRAPIIKKTFSILKQIARRDHGLSISELSRTLDISKGTVHGITAALAEEGVIVRDPISKRFTLGHTLFELGRTAFDRIDVKNVARPYMEHLMRQTQESVFLGVQNVDHVTILDVVEAATDLKITSPIGTTIPLLAGATGKVFLAYMAQDRVTVLLQSKGIHRYTEKTMTRPTDWLTHARAAKTNGYAVDDEEYISGVRAVAAPIRNNGKLLAAIWVVGFKPSLDDDKMKTVIKEIKKTALEISRKISRQGSPNSM